LTKPFLIGGASMPRSGHHFLHRILMSYFGDSFGYCSYYYPWDHDFFPECCKNIPCTKYLNTSLSVFFQKSHDFDLTDPVNKADLNLVQIRAPIERLYSNFDLHVKNHPKNRKLSNFRQFALREYYYYVAFWRKWITAASNNTLVVTYEDLKNQPDREMLKIIQATGLEADETRILNAIAQQKVSRGGNARYVARNVEQHEFFDQEWTAEYLTKIRNACLDYDEFYD